MTPIEEEFDESIYEFCNKLTKHLHESLQMTISDLKITSYTYTGIGSIDHLEGRFDIDISNAEKYALEKYMNYMNYLNIQRVIFNNPVTVVIWKDGTKTIVRAKDGDKYDKEKGLALCVMKKVFGNKSKFNNILHEWVDKDDEEEYSRKFKKLEKECIKKAKKINGESKKKVKK